MSNYQWLEQLPSNWKVYSLGHVSRISTGTADVQDADPDGHFPFYVRSPHILRLNRYTNDTEAVITAGDGNVGGIFHIARGRFAAHQRVYVIEPARRLEIRFLAYVMATTFKASLSGNTAKSTVESLRRPMLTSFRMPGPPLSDQRTIADYLDREIAEIDALTQDLGDLHELLEARWSSELVTSVQTGLSKNSPTTTGHREWPHAPEHWTDVRLKSTVASSRNGSWGMDPGVQPATARCIRVADFDKIRGTIHDHNITDRSYPIRTVASDHLHFGDLVIEKSGGGPTSPVGNVVLYEGSDDDMYSNFVARIEVAPHIDSLYALYLHKCLHESGVTTRSVKQTTGIQNLDSSAYFNERVMLPPHTEQVAIGQHLRSRRNELDDSLSEINRAITLAKERRAALITAAVTGQIDVTAKNRPAAEQLEDDVKELS